MAGTKRVFLWTVVASLTLAAVLGVWVLLFGGFFGIEEEVFATLGTLFLFSLPALSSAAMIERSHWPAVGRVSLAVAGAGVVLYLFVIWMDSFWGAGDWLWKPMVLLPIWAWALPWAAMLGLTAFANALTVVRIASIALVFITAAALSVLLITEVDWEGAWRLFGVLAILLVLGTITTPILHVIAGIDRRASVETTRLELKLTCPLCLLEQTLPTGASRCRGCRLRFTIDVEEPRCPSCGYALHKLTTPACPECGTKLSVDEVPAAAQV